jgi:MFS family permease
VKGRFVRIADTGRQPPRALELGVPGIWLGVVSACFAVVPLILAVPSGQAVDRFGGRRVMLVGRVALSAECLAAAVTPVPVGVLAVLVVVLGLGLGRRPAAVAVAARGFGDGPALLTESSDA